MGLLRKTASLLTVGVIDCRSDKGPRPDQCDAGCHARWTLAWRDRGGLVSL